MGGTSGDVRLDGNALGRLWVWKMMSRRLSLLGGSDIMVVVGLSSGYGGKDVFIGTCNGTCQGCGGCCVRC